MERSRIDPAALVRHAIHPFRLALALTVAAAAGALARPARAADAPLGAVAVIALPAGGVAKPADGAELARMRAARNAPRLLFAGTVGDGEHAPMRYEFHRAGRYTEPGHDAFDMRALAQQLTAPAEAWTFAGWRTPPVFDREHHVLFWAYDVKRSDGRRTLGFAAFLTREGVLLFQRTSDDLAAFDREDAAFRGLLARVRVNDGRRWEDFVASDPIAAGSMADLVAMRGVPGASGESSARAKPAAAATDSATVWLRRMRELLGDGGFRISWLVAMVVGLRIVFGIAKAIGRQRVKPEEIGMPTRPGSEPRRPFDDNRPIN